MYVLLIPCYVVCRLVIIIIITIITYMYVKLQVANNQRITEKWNYNNVGAVSNN